ncbi:O-antigen polymerase [Diaminobutyricimonas sp. LJ205]|uniref:O-antigen polymerase n=1 Tax=Diaminobutyricimonas sp. LJ205 TaxID=2683590 RepID=UPI0012F4AA59|nr:O-antigen polymerase [Diaminobutyricimonas sp. LJ205]
MLPKQPTAFHLVGWVAIAFLMLFQSFAAQPTNAILAAESLVIAGAAILTFSRILPGSFWSPASIFLLVLALFHLGLAPFWLLDIDPRLPRAEDYLWFYGISGAFALQLSMWGMVAYTLAVTLRAHTRRHISVPREPRSFVVTGRAYSRWGAVLLIGSVAWWFLLSVGAGGVGILFGSYSQYLRATSSTSVDDIYYAIGVGLGLTLVARADTVLSKAGLFCFLGFAFIAFFIGLRGEVLFPLAVGATVLAMRRRMPNGALTILFLIIVLTVVNGAKQIRQVGISNADFDWAQASPLAALGELGSSLRVVATVVDWHHQLGEPFRMGETYVVTIARALESVFDPAARLPASMDFRLFNAEIMNRAGAIGGSTAAEAYHNFGVIGVIVGMGLLGWLFGHFSSGPLSATQIAVYVCLAVPLFNHIRNSFVPVVPMTVVALGFVALVVVVSGQRRASVPSGPNEN